LAHRTMRRGRRPGLAPFVVAAGAWSWSTRARSDPQAATS
jgi:hypothetical protein